MVINVKDAPDGWTKDKDYVYIGRIKSLGTCGLGNPYIIGVDGDRYEVISQYILWLGKQAMMESFRNKVMTTVGKTLVCHCAPSPCHGEFLEALGGFLRVLSGGVRPTDQAAARRLSEWQIGAFMNALGKGWENRVRHELSEMAEANAHRVYNGGPQELSWPEYRKMYLNKALRWKMPTYKEPIRGFDWRSGG